MPDYCPLWYIEVDDDKALLLTTQTAGARKFNGPGTSYKVTGDANADMVYKKEELGAVRKDWCKSNQKIFARFAGYVSNLDKDQLEQILMDVPPPRQQFRGNVKQESGEEVKHGGTWAKQAIQQLRDDQLLKTTQYYVDCLPQWNDYWTWDGKTIAHRTRRKTVAQRMDLVAVFPAPGLVETLPDIERSNCIGSGYDCIGRTAFSLSDNTSQAPTSVPSGSQSHSAASTQQVTNAPQHEITEEESSKDPGNSPGRFVQAKKIPQKEEETDSNQ